jgi:hypothetical protein
MALRTHYRTRTTSISLAVLLGANLLFGSTLALAGPAGATGHDGVHHRRGHGGAGLFARMDKNGDGKIEKAEARAAASKHFTEMDTNGDGALTRDEQSGKDGQARHAQRRAEHFARMDKNGDGQLERAESRMPEAAFESADTNKDGKLTRDELAASFQKMSAARRAARFAELDTNSDGKIAQAEALAQADRRFASLDGNKDGQVTREEAHAALAAKRGPGHDCHDAAKKTGGKADKGRAS